MNIARRQLIKSAAGLPLAAVLADPLIAGAVAAGLADVSIETAGGKTVRGALALPKAPPAPAVLLVHEWWGLNAQIKSVAAELAREGFVALALDLYDGHVAGKREDARTYMGRAMKNAGVTAETAAAWVNWLRAHDKGAGKVGAIGWCFGGGWALNAALVAPVDATIVYYGSVAPEYGGLGRAPADLARLEGPVMGHYGTLDKWITKAMVADFESRMAAAGRPVTSHWYAANHAFANPTQARYDEADAKLAWRRTLAFLKKNLS